MAQALLGFQALDDHLHGDGAASQVGGRGSVVLWERQAQQAVALLEKEGVVQMCRSVGFGH
ncbi:hypothetical protein LPV64_07775, partial [Ralstonia pseudosolanacearum]|nr:hypothetical protein [Ralstonia pseudosolanacearum]